MTTSPEGGKPSYNLESLVLGAFRMARDRGKPDWRRMAIPVVKNRLLHLSKGEFDETLHNATNMREVFAQLGTLVRVEGGWVELLPDVLAGETQAASSSADGGDRRRIRKDLWRATIDYSSGKRYAWDTSALSAREAQPGDQLFLPTISKEDAHAWRTAFVQNCGSPDELAKWRDEDLGTLALPAQFRARWNRFIHAKVRSRLEDWFGSNGIPVPELAAPATDDRSDDHAVRDLRHLITECVAVMTEQELAAIQLPSTVVLRAYARGRLR